MVEQREERENQLMDKTNSVSRDEYLNWIHDKHVIPEISSIVKRAYWTW